MMRSTKRYASKGIAKKNLPVLPIQMRMRPEKKEAAVVSTKSEPKTNYTRKPRKLVLKAALR